MYMRILHTSDWHLGTRLCDRDRFDEQKAFLDWLLTTLKRENIDVLIVAGDIFDTSNPPNSAETLYYNFLCSLKDSGVIKTVIIGGNHDSVSKLNSSKSLLKQLSVEVLGGSEENKEKLIIPVTSGSSKIDALICAVPFLRERDIRTPVPGESWEEKIQSIGQGIQKYYHHLFEIINEKYNTESIPLIATGHLFAAGSSAGEGQRDLYVGNLGALDVGIFHEKYDYIALGHIHRAQCIGGMENIRYSGSPLAMEFGEGANKSVTVIEFYGKKIEDIQSIAVPTFRTLVRFRGTVEEICSQMENFSIPDSPFWADAEVEKGSAAGDINLILNEKASEKGIELLRIRNIRAGNENIIQNKTRIEIKDLDPVEVFSEKCKSAGIPEEEKDELMPLYKELLSEIYRGENTVYED